MPPEALSVIELEDPGGGDPQIIFRLPRILSIWVCVWVGECGGGVQIEVVPPARILFRVGKRLLCCGVHVTIKVVQH